MIHYDTHVIITCPLYTPYCFLCPVFDGHTSRDWFPAPAGDIAGIRIPTCAFRQERMEQKAW